MHYRVFDIRNISSHKIPGIETEHQLKALHGKYSPWGVFVKNDNKLKLICASKDLFNACFVAEKLCNSIEDAIVMAIASSGIGLAWSPMGKITSEYNIAA